MEFVEFAEHCSQIETETADTAIRDHVTTLLKRSGEDLSIVARFVQGRIFPAWDQTKLDIGPALCYDAIGRAAGPNITADDVEDRLAEYGDIGEVAASFEFEAQQGLGAFTNTSGTQSDASDSERSIIEVSRNLRKIAEANGEGSQERKLEILFSLFNRSQPSEARYLSRLVLSEMRIGVGEGTVRDAISDAFGVPIEPVERAIQVSNDIGLVAETARDEGVDGLNSIRLEIGRPVKAMLAQSGTTAEAIEDWEEAIVDWKYDGARIQAHVNDEITLYSRNLENVTDPLPEIVEFLEESVNVPVILDGEVVAVDDSGNPRPFQEVLRRFRRKYDVEVTRDAVELRPYFFDCLHADGEDLLDHSLDVRRKHLTEVLDRRHSDSIRSSSLEEIADIEHTAIRAGHEGIMLKNPESLYSPGRRGKNWLKVKPDVETIDCVITGAEWGEGRRANLLGTFHLSVGDEDADDGFARIGNVATGITDEELDELTELFKPLISSEQGQDVTIRPKVVIEVGYEEIQRSPTYSSGYALRFPRFVGVRDDLDPDDADSLLRLKRLANGTSD